MIPILFEHDATDFTTHGIGDLIDIIECVVEQNDEGEYEMSFTYPVTGELLNELTIGRLVYAKANPWQDNQIFRIYGYEKVIAGKLTVNCQHISYDLGSIPVKIFKAAKTDDANTVLQKLKTNSMAVTGFNLSRFNLSSNVTGQAQREEGYFEVDTPNSLRAMILDGDDSVKGCFGGDAVFDNYNISLQATGGADRGVVIEYGVDLMDLNQEENISEMATGVMPYFTYSVEVSDSNSTDDGQRVAYGDIQYATGTFVQHRVVPLDLTSYFPNQEEHTAPSVVQLNAKAREWMAAEDGFGEPEINLTVSYASLGQDVRLYDAVTVRFVKMGIDVKSKVHSYTYDVINERVREVEVGKTKSSFLFNLEDASRLKKGLLPPERIKNKSITADKYADGSVGGGALKADSVSNWHLKEDSVGAAQLQEDAVKEENIAEDAVTEKKVKDLSITVNKIVDGAIVTEKIASNAVTGNKVLDQAISYAKTNTWVRNNLDQVGINQSDIAAIKAIFADYIQSRELQAKYIFGTTVSCDYLVLNKASTTMLAYIDRNLDYATSGHTHPNTYASINHTHSSYASTGYVTTSITSHQGRCRNYSTT